MNYRPAAERQLGRFKVRELFFRYMRPLDGVNLFHNMIVLDVQRDWAKDETTYLAMHPDFRVVEFGEQIPEYIATFDTRSALPTWGEVQRTSKGLIDVDALLSDVGREHGARVVAVGGTGHWKLPSPAAAVFGGVGGFDKYEQREQQRYRERDGLWRLGLRWLDRLLQRGRAIVRAVLGRHRNAAAGDGVPQGRQHVPATAGRLAVHVRHEHDANRDGVPGEGARGDARNTAGHDPEVAGLGAYPSLAGCDIGFDPGSDTDRRLAAHWREQVGIEGTDSILDGTEGTTPRKSR
jgi:hypothetical protein